MVMMKVRRDKSMFKENGFIHRMIIKLLLYCESKLKGIYIMDRSVDELYLIRRVLFKSRFFSIYIHRFMRSDRDTPHDHPWPFFTYIATKGYMETQFVQMAEGYSTRGLIKEEIHYRKPHSLAWRGLKTIHKVEVPQTYTAAGNYLAAPLTVCILGPRFREWGFVHKLYAKDMKLKKGGNIDIAKDPDRVVGHQWVNNRDYLNEDRG
jgi:hypothetical protein